MSRRLFIILLVVLVVLFVLAVGAGAARPRAPASGSAPGWLHWLGDRFVPKRPLRASDVSLAIPDSCRRLLTDQVVTIAPLQGCVLDVAASSAPVRALSLEKRSGTAEVILTSFAKNQPAVTLKPDTNWPTLQVFKEGGELRIECLLPPCEVGVKQ